MWFLLYETVFSFSLFITFKCLFVGLPTQKQELCL
ncbi:unnamed protein product [Paramecium octaurelia]|uniref:Uncharacterized protein n=1 Tax=Paramecium octaurelia TaxID=43137 RepID=A0A8S1YK51_PAROT|nr:unnamed protein product [Paramecium octaurelia]